MSHNGFGFTGSMAPFPNCCCTLTLLGLPSLPDDPSKDNYAEFNAVGQAARAYEWTLSEEGPSEFNKQHVAEPSCTETQAPESRTYGSGPVQYPPSPAVGTEQPDDPVPPPPIHTQGQVITRSTPVTHHNGNQQAAVATETQPIIIDEGKCKLNLLYNSAFRRLIIFLYPQPARERKTVYLAIWRRSCRCIEHKRVTRRLLHVAFPFRKSRSPKPLVKALYREP